MALEKFANNPSTTVLSGGTTEPAAGTSETWTVSNAAYFPAASSTASPPTQFHIGDPALIGEIIAVTNTSGNNWTVTRGAESTVPAAHAPEFSITQVVSAGAFDVFVQTVQMTNAIATETQRAETAEATFIQVGGDLGGTVTAPQVRKIQGTTIQAPTGGATAYLNATGNWTVPSGGGASGGPADWAVVTDTAFAGGADPTGADDSTAAIQAALLSFGTIGGASQGQGGVVYMPPGQYLTSKTLIIPAGVKLTGSGWGSQITLITGSNCDIIQWATYQSSTQATILGIAASGIANAFWAGARDMALHGDAFHTTVPGYNYGINITTNPGSGSSAPSDPDFDPLPDVENVRIEACTGDGLFHSGRSGAFFKRVWVAYCNGVGITPSFDSTLIDCLSEGNGAGLYLNHSSNLGSGVKSYNNNDLTWVSGTSYSPASGAQTSVCVYNGAMYFCTAAVSGTTVPSADTAHWTALTTATAPLATGWDWYFDTGAGAHNWAAVESQQPSKGSYYFKGPNAGAISIDGQSENVNFNNGQPGYNSANPHAYAACVFDAVSGVKVTLNSSTQGGGSGVIATLLNSPGTNDLTAVTDGTESAVFSGGYPTYARVNGTPVMTGTTITAPAGGATAYLNATGHWTVPAGGGGGGAVPGMAVIWADNLGISNTGASSCSTAVQAAITAAAGPCKVVFGVGTYLFSTAITLAKNQSVQGQGRTVTKFTWSGAGNLFLATEAAVSGTWNGSDNAGQLSGFSITGPYGTGGTAGIKYGALQGIRIDDVGFYGLDGGAVTGYQVTSGVDWAEEAAMTRLDISGCGATSKFVFSFAGTSFDYSSIDAVVVVESGIDVIALNNAEMQGLDLGLRGNLHGATAAQTGALISMDRGNTSGTSVMGGASFRVSMEGDDTTDGGLGTFGHYLLYMGSSNSQSQFSASGVFSIYNAGAPGLGIYNPDNLPVSFTGILNDGVHQMLDGESGVVYGGQALSLSGMDWGALYENTLFPEFSDVMAFQLASGAQTLTTDTSSAYVRRFNFLVKQPSSGAAGTVTWPGSFHWLNGTAPTLQTASNAIDQIDAIWDPVTATYYARAGNGSGGGGSFTGGTLSSYIAPDVVALTFATTIVVNAAAGNAFGVTIGGNTTFAAPSSPANGQVIRFRITSGGSHTVSWNAVYDFGTGSAPTLSTTSGKVDIVAFEYVASISKWCCLGTGLGY